MSARVKRGSERGRSGHDLCACIDDAHDVPTTCAMSDPRPTSPSGGILDKLHKFAFASSCLYACVIALLATPFFQRQ